MIDAGFDQLETGPFDCLGTGPSTRSGQAGDLNSALSTLHTDLETIFRGRLHSLLVYGQASIAAASASGPPDVPIETLATLTDRISAADLSVSAAYIRAWRRAGLAPPLFLSIHELRRSIDAFPIEYGDMMAHHLVVAGSDPFEGLEVASDDLRRACEVQVRGHLIHLREGYLECEGRPQDVGLLMASSARSFTRLLANVARLGGARLRTIEEQTAFAASINLAPDVVRTVTTLAHRRPQSLAGAAALYSAYLDTVERLWHYVDAWRDERRAGGG